ncbi:MAG: serine hydrolase, partial [Gemmatimonadaceae bacterium]|nr:serine hydrolase [Gemmatimonadaceae bacterium]
MRRLPGLLVAAVAAVATGTLAACSAPAPGRAPTPTPADLTALRTAIEQRIAGVPGAQAGVWLHDLATGDTLAINAAASFHAASTMKVPVMIELFRRADAGALRLDSSIILRNAFASIVDG